MKTSSETDKIYPAVIAMQQSLEAIERSKEVKTGKYSFKYAPLDAIMDKVKPLFAANGLAVMQGVDADALTTRLIHSSGQWVESETHLNREHANMQGFGGEVTFKRRYALSALIGLVSDDDNDAPAMKRGPQAGARTGIGADLPDDWKIYLGDLADECSTLVNRGRVTEALSRIEDANLEADQRVYMEDQMDSKVRSTLKAAVRPKA
jgi:hypothetical protein